MTTTVTIPAPTREMPRPIANPSHSQAWLAGGGGPAGHGASSTTVLGRVPWPWSVFSFTVGGKTGGNGSGFGGGASLPASTAAGLCRRTTLPQAGQRVL